MFGITKSTQETSLCCGFCSTRCMQSKVDIQLILAPESFPANIATTCLQFPFISRKGLSVRNRQLCFLLHIGRIHRNWILFIHPEAEPSFTLSLYERKIRATEIWFPALLRGTGKKMPVQSNRIKIVTNKKRP